PWTPESRNCIVLTVSRSRQNFELSMRVSVCIVLQTDVSYRVAIHHGVASQKIYCAVSAQQRGTSVLSVQSGGTGNGGISEDFGANAWLVDELYKQYLEDKNQVDKSWWPTLEEYGAKLRASAPSEQAAQPPATAQTAPSPGTMVAPTTGT